MDKYTLLQNLSELGIRQLFQERKDWNLLCDSNFHALFDDWGISDQRLIPEEGPPPAKDRIGKFTVICSEKSEDVLVSKLKKNGAPFIGLYKHLVPRLAADVAPRFAGSNNAVPSTLQYAIFCLPRSGSTLVARELTQIGAGEPKEHFRGFVADLIKYRDASQFDLRSWWQLVVQGHTASGIFGTKIIHDFWKMAAVNMTQSERDFFSDQFKRFKIVYIERSDKVGQAVSNVVARRTGVWHLWSKSLKESYNSKIDALDQGALEQDLDAGVQFYNKFKSSEEDLREFLDALGVPLIKIEYDDLLSSPKIAIAKAAVALGLDVKQEYFESDLALEPTTTEAHRRLAEALEARVGGRGKPL